MSQHRPSRPQWVFVDSTAYYAAAVRRDANHPAAQAILTRLAAEHARLFTSRYILAETHALLLNRQRDSVRAYAALRTIEQAASTTIVPVTTADEDRAHAILVQYKDHLFTLTDAVSFAVMDRLGITRAFAFDRDFLQYGFTVLQP